VTVHVPGGDRVALTNEQRFAQLELPGLYRAISAGHTQQFAVNLAPEESDTAPLDFDQLEQFGVPLQSQVTQRPGRVAQEEASLHAAQLESRQKVWRWLLVGCLGFIIIETWWAGRAARLAQRPTEGLP
jgi:hypothetical protein